MVLRIIGAGGHGKVVADVAYAMGLTDIAFLDDRYPALQKVGQFAVVGSSDDQSWSERFCAIGANSIRSDIFDKLSLSDSPVLVHPSSIVSRSVTLAEGTVLVAGTIVNADARIGKGVILNTVSSVDHDCVIGDFVHVSPGARLGGGVTVGPRSWIGIGAVVREGITIGSDVVVAAGAAVINDVPDGSRVGGVPARYI